MWLFHHRILLDSEEEDEVDGPKHPDDCKEDQEAVPKVLALVLLRLVLPPHLQILRSDWPTLTKYEVLICHHLTSLLSSFSFRVSWPIRFLETKI